MTIAVFLLSLLAAMALGMPIAYALIVCGIALMLHLDIFDAQIVAQNIINGADSFPLMAVPFFLLAGEIMNVGGLSRRIVDMCLALVGHIKGGLGYVAIVAGVILSALSGSAVADAAALSALLVPMMIAAGHDKARSAGLVAATGIIGPVIPPSIAFVIFGVAANLSITKLFLAGITPGIYIAIALWFAWSWEVRKEAIVPPPRKSHKELGRAVVDAFWALMLPFIIIFGLRFGVFTPTEAAVVAAVYSLIVSVFIYRELTFKDLYAVFVTAAKTTSVVMFLVAAALVSAWLITVAELPTKIVALLEPFLDNKILLMFAIMVLVVVVGTAMDMTPTILILTPILMPLVKAAGIDPIYFGVLFIINNSIGLITPPVGVVLNVVAGVTKTSMEDVMKGVWPFLLAELFVLLLLILFPPLVTVPARWLIGSP
jgi:TRAP-type transport system large permease protein